jgi:hypothetical protein
LVCQNRPVYKKAVIIDYGINLKSGVFVLQKRDNIRPAVERMMNTGISSQYFVFKRIYTADKIVYRPWKNQGLKTIIVDAFEDTNLHKFFFPKYLDLKNNNFYREKKLQKKE